MNDCSRNAAASQKCTSNRGRRRLGTGYRLLGYVKRLPVNANSTLGNTLGLRIIAEGIESQSHEFLRSLKCENAQGYFFSRSQTWSNLVTILQRAREIDSGNCVIPLCG